MSVFMREEPELGGAEISFWAGSVCEASTQFIFIEILWGFIEMFYIIFVHLPVTSNMSIRVLYRTKTIRSSHVKDD